MLSIIDIIDWLPRESGELGHLSSLLFTAVRYDPPLGGEFLNFHCSVSPIEEGEIKNFDRVLYKFPSHARGPPPYPSLGMADDRSIIQALDERGH